MIQSRFVAVLRLKKSCVAKFDFSFKGFVFYLHARVADFWQRVRGGFSRFQNSTRSRKFHLLHIVFFSVSLNSLLLRKNILRESSRFRDLQSLEFISNFGNTRTTPSKQKRSSENFEQSGISEARLFLFALQSVDISTCAVNQA